MSLLSKDIPRQVVSEKAINRKIGVKRLGSFEDKTSVLLQNTEMISTSFEKTYYVD